MQFTRKAAEYRFILTPLLQEEPHYTPADSHLVSTLLKVYREHTGQEGRCISIGGGTYVHNIPGGVAFGMEREGYDIGCTGRMNGCRCRNWWIIPCCISRQSKGCAPKRGREKDEY